MSLKHKLASKVVLLTQKVLLKETQMKEQVNKVFNQAQKTFSCTEKSFEKKLQKLIRLMNKTTAKDLNLNESIMDNEFWEQPNKAPVTYISLYEDDLITMGVFVLKDGMKLPLHDHPEMHGLIKVLTGKIKVKSFSIEEDPEFLYCKPPPIVLTAQKQPDILADSTSDVCVLRPKSKNIHEIESVDGPAAFFDILSPPYETPMRDTLRRCNYFEITAKVHRDSYKLTEIEPPVWFWNDCIKYLGPAIKFEHDFSVFQRVLSQFRNVWKIFSGRCQSS
ncbi:2-aminoethanethiol dioxygenase-like [Onthophagus taurus]|uniref:2-aminoethanethiol dioxygenase-like n=1 Tax=Onthophagus taurus TaxID=166361 RepID=UPI0039BEB496